MWNSLASPISGPWRLAGLGRDAAGVDPDSDVLAVLGTDRNLGVAAEYCGLQRLVGRQRERGVVLPSTMP
jgi:hypothetical protein